MVRESVVSVKGAIVGEVVRRRLMEALEEKTKGGAARCVLDCSGVQSLDHKALIDLLLMRKRLRDKGGDLTLTHCRADLERLLGLLNLRDLVGS
jgi:anti-anti-sigma regulatory factor